MAKQLKKTSKKTAKTTNNTVKKTAKLSNTIKVRNADGDPDTTATIVVRNKINYTPKISVIIPVYNVEQYLRECLDSVVNQTLKEIEIICVDDGSTDSSLDILKEYAKKDSRITVLTQKNLHAGVARNAGLALARGEYLSFLDSDDFFELNMLEKIYNKAKKDGSDIVLYGNSVYDCEKQEITSRFHIDKKFIESSPFAPELFNDSLFCATNPNPWTKLFSRDLFEKNDLHYENTLRCNDITCVCSALAVAKKISAIDESFVNYRSNRKNSVTSNRALKVDDFLYSVDKLEKSLKRLNVYDSFIKTFINRIKNSYSWEIRACSEEQKQQIQTMARSVLSNNVYNLLYVYAPKVSVIIPVYNVEKYLCECLDSVINQTLKDIEIICINDGSTDKSMDILQKYAKKDKRIIVIDQKNQGLSASRNNALKIANGEYILFLDSDDYLRLDACSLLYNNCAKYNIEMYNFAGTNFDDVTGKVQQLSFQKITYIDCSKKFYDRAEIETFMFKIPISACRFFYKREFLAKHNIVFPQGLNFEDNVFVRKASLYVQRFGGTNEILYNRRVHPGSITQNIDKFFLDYLHIIQMVADMYKKEHIKFDITRNIVYEYVSNCVQYFKSFDVITKQKYSGVFSEFLQEMQKEYNLKFEDISYRAELENWWHNKTKKQINLNKPRTFNEKVQWLKLFDSTPIKTRLADKYLVRDWVAEKIGDKYLIPLLGVYDSFEEIDFDKLPNQFVIKCNHGSAYNIIVKDKSKLNLVLVKEKLDKWMSENFAFKNGCELHYRDIQPKIIIEKFISNGGEALWDYKFWCFNGEVKYMQFRDDFSSDLKMAFYDLSWKKQPFYYDHPLYDKDLEKPDNFDEMVKIAKKLCQGFAFVCVDLYRLNNGEIKFGEMTFTRSSGVGKWNSEKYNKMLGDLIKLPKLAYNMNTGLYYKLKHIKPIHINKQTKPYLLFPYYLLATMWMNVISLPLAKFKRHTKRVIYSHSTRGRMAKLQSNIIEYINKNAISTDNKIAELKANLDKNTIGIDNKIAELKASIEHNQVLYFNPFETVTRFERGLCDMIDAPNFENRFKKLISGLSADDTATIVRIIRRLQMIKGTDTELDLFTKEEKELLSKVREANREILKVSGNLYVYKNYLLPVNHFEASVFFYNHGIEKLDSIDNFKSKDILDIGGFIGDSVLMFAPLTNKKIYSFEASKSNYDLMLKTIKLNNIKNAVPVHTAVGDKPGTIELRFNGSASSQNDIMVKNPEYIEKCPVIKIDDYVREHNINVGLIKVDIEGAEQSFLRGAKETIKKYKPTLLISIYHNVDDFLDIKPMIESWNLGYKFKIFKPIIESVSGETLLICEQ